MSLEELCNYVETGEKEKSADLARKLLDEGIDPLVAIAALTETMNKVGEAFARLEIFLPQVVFAGEALTAVVEILRPKIMDSGEGSSKGKVVLGVVKGDMHEIGKNIVKLMLQTNGFEVRDLGYDVDSLTFIKEAEAMEADFIAASSLMTTTMPGQKEILELLKEKGLREKYKVVIGGAPTGEDWAQQIGADLYCPDASCAPRMMAKLLDGK